MAAGYCFRCSNCDFEVTAWDDGNPYIVDDEGQRHFFYHPHGEAVIEEVLARSAWTIGKSAAEVESELGKHTGNMPDALCRDCGAVSKVDENPELARCGECQGTNLDDAMELEGKPCPKCKKGTFRHDRENFCIS